MARQQIYQYQQLFHIIKFEVIYFDPFTKDGTHSRSVGRGIGRCKKSAGRRAFSKRDFELAGRKERLSPPAQHAPLVHSE